MLNNSNDGPPTSMMLRRRPTSVRPTGGISSPALGLKLTHGGTGLSQRYTNVDTTPSKGVKYMVRDTCKFAMAQGGLSVLGDTPASAMRHGPHGVMSRSAKRDRRAKI